MRWPKALATAAFTLASTVAHAESVASRTAARA